MQKTSVFLLASVCRTHNKRNVLFYWTMKPVRHFKTFFFLFRIRQTDTTRKTDVFWIHYILKTKQNLVSRQKKDRILFNTPRETSRKFGAVFARFNFSQKSLMPFLDLHQILQLIYNHFLDFLYSQDYPGLQYW